MCVCVCVCVCVRPRVRVCMCVCLCVINERRRRGRVCLLSSQHIMYGIMTEKLVIREIGIYEAGDRGDSDSRMTSFKVIMPLKLQSTKILINSI